MVAHFKTIKSCLLASFLCLLPIVYSACSSGSSDATTGDNNNEPVSVQFWLEPAATNLGKGQIISLFAALKPSSTAYNSYIDPASVTWSSSNSAVVQVTADGLATGISDGVATITARYQNYESTTILTVSGIMTEHSLFIDATQGIRSYLMYDPSPGTGAARPLLLSWHGGSGSAMIQAAMSNMVGLAAQQNMIIVYLEGSGVLKTFNAGSCCGSAKSDNVDDVKYANKVIDDVISKKSINSAKIFSSGFSNGAMMSHRLACDLSSRLAGVVTVSGGSGQYDSLGTKYYDCNPTKPVRVIHYHAKNDRNYPYGGGYGQGSSETAFYSVDATIADWRTRNNLTSSFTTENVTATTVCYKYNTKQNSSMPSEPITLCVLDPIDIYDPATEIVFGGGHSWPKGVRTFNAASDTPDFLFDLNSYFWNFLNTL